MQQEDNKSLLGGMAWDDIAWHIKYAEDNGILRTQLGFDFPKLLGYLIIDDETYEKKKREFFYKRKTWTYGEIIAKNEGNWLRMIIEKILNS